MHQVAQIAFNASKGDFDELKLEVEVDMEGGTVGGKCWQTVNGEVEYLSMWDPDRKPDLMDLSFELYEELKKQAGGELIKYTVTINEELKARARFEYKKRSES